MTAIGNSGLFSAAVELETLIPARAEKFRRSVNRDQRPFEVQGIACIVLHATADEGDEEAAESWLCEPRSGVSAHLHIRRDGTVVRLVGDHFRAWHAGQSKWRGTPHVNDFSLGWELANRNDGREEYTSAQYASVARLASHYAAQGLPLSAFVSHAEVAVPAGRKTDPVGFDWTGFKIDILRILADA